MITWTHQRRKVENLRMRQFDRNGGNLLKVKLSKLTKSANEQLKIYTAEEMKKATDNYSDDRKVVMQRCNPGTFYRGNLGDGAEKREVVVMNMPAVPKSKLELFVDQLIFLSQPHTNLEKIMGCCLETSSPSLVYELHGNGNVALLDCRHDGGLASRFSFEIRLKAAAGAARGLAYLQSRAALCHANICSANILLDDSFDAKVFYAVASGRTVRDATSSHYLGNCVYRDPQLAISGQKSDVYSFGVVLVELLTRGVALASHRWGDAGNLATWFASLIHDDDKLSDVVDAEEDGRVVREVAAMAARCLSVRTEERPSMRELAKLSKRMSFKSRPCQKSRIFSRLCINVHQLKRGKFYPYSNDRATSSSFSKSYS